MTAAADPTAWLFTKPEPWDRPDPNPYPTITLWAWLARLEDRIRHRPHIFDDNEQDDAW